MPDPGLSPMASVARLGWGRRATEMGKNSKPQKMLENAVNIPNRLHAT
jgi:hypothetical protein